MYSQSTVTESPGVLCDRLSPSEVRDYWTNHVGWRPFTHDEFTPGTGLLYIVEQRLLEGVFSEMELAPSLARIDNPTGVSPVLKDSGDPGKVDLFHTGKIGYFHLDKLYTLHHLWSSFAEGPELKTAAIDHLLLPPRRE